LGKLISPILRVQESKRKTVAPIYSLYKEKCGCENLTNVVSASRVDAVVGMEGSVVVGAALERDTSC
jgi:hypothetical protein